MPAHPSKVHMLSSDNVEGRFVRSMLESIGIEVLCGTGSTAPQESHIIVVTTSDLHCPQSILHWDELRSRKAHWDVYYVPDVFFTFKTDRPDTRTCKRQDKTGHALELSGLGFFLDPEV